MYIPVARNYLILKDLLFGFIQGYEIKKVSHFVQMKNAEPETNRNTSAVMSQKMDCDLEYFQRVSLFDFPVENATSTRDALLKQMLMPDCQALHQYAIILMMLRV